MYCNYKRREEQKTADLTAALIKQLIQGNHLALGSVEAMYSSHKDRRTTPSTKELVDTLTSVTSLYSRVYIVVDALDECTSSEVVHSGLPRKPVSPSDPARYQVARHLEIHA